MSGVKITNIEEGLQAMQILHEKGPSTVILSSFESEDKLITLATSVKGKYAETLMCLGFLLQFFFQI